VKVLSATRDRLQAARHRVGRVPSRIPLRTQLVAAILVLGAIAMVLFGFVGTERLRSNLTGTLDQRLSGELLGAIHGGRGDMQSFSGPNGSQAPANSSWGAILDSSGKPIVYEGTTQEGLITVTSSAQHAPDLPKLTSSFVAAHTAPFTVDAAGGGARWRIEVISYPPSVSGLPNTATFAFGLTQESVDGPVSALIRIDLILGAVVLALLGLAAWLVVRASLRPLVDVEHTAEAIAAGDLSRRVPVRSDRTEVGRLSAALNGMLGHIEVAFADRSESEAAALATAEQMRRFAADASHELRTPLTSIRGFAELSRSGVIPPGPDTDRAMERIENEAIRMTGLVEDLLLLARLDQQRPLEANPVDLLAIAADSVHDATVIAPDHETTLVVADPGAREPIVTGDEPRLRQVVTNLVANALHHTPPGTHVSVGVRVVDRFAVLEVTDDGPGLAPPDARKVFERFYRADSSRTRASGGAGLGLSIVTALVSAHGGTVDLHTALGQGATFSVRLPLATLPMLPDGGTSALPAGPHREPPSPLGPGFLPPPDDSTPRPSRPDTAVDEHRALTR
jgi:two-component system OmpR family sensor kinase